MTTTTPTVQDPEQMHSETTPPRRAKGAKGLPQLQREPRWRRRRAAATHRRADGAAIACAVYVTKTGTKKTSVRGISTKHAKLEAARAAVEKMATEATGKLGWTRRERRAGFVAKPDSFSTLPAANAVPTAAPTTPAKTTLKKK